MSPTPLDRRAVSWRRFLVGPPPEPDRILHYGLWFRGHNNPRYAELLPRLRRLDPLLIVCSGRRIPRGLQFRALEAVRPLRHRLILGRASRRYRWMLTAQNDQIPHFRGMVVSDVDDPVFTPREVALLNSPNLAAYVVTDERAARRFEALGVTTPWHVIPQGVGLSALTDELRRAVASRNGDDGALVVGYMAGFLLSAGDSGGDNPLYNVDHLLGLWDEIHERVPEARLWLLGEPSARVTARIAGRGDIRLIGRVPKDEVLAYAANFDVALYPRTADQGIQAAKIAEYMGAGAPIVSYDYEVTKNVRAAGAGVLVTTPREFVDAVVALAGDQPRRAQLAAAARRAGAALDWDVLARRYEDEILDRYLPPSSATSETTASAHEPAE